MRLTWDHTSFLTLLQRPKIVGVSSTASVFKQFAVSVVDVEEESLFDRLARAFFILHCAQFIEDQVVALCSVCWGGTQIFRMCVHACLGQSKFSHQTSKYRPRIWQNGAHLQFPNAFRYSGSNFADNSDNRPEQKSKINLPVKNITFRKVGCLFVKSFLMEGCIWSIHAGVNILVNTRRGLASLAVIKAARGRSRSTLT